MNKQKKKTTPQPTIFVATKNLRKRVLTTNKSTELTGDRYQNLSGCMKIWVADGVITDPDDQVDMAVAFSWPHVCLDRLPAEKGSPHPTTNNRKRGLLCLQATAQD